MVLIVTLSLVSWDTAGRAPCGASPSKKKNDTSGKIGVAVG